MVWVIGSKGMLGTEICRQLIAAHIDHVATDLEVDIRQYVVSPDFCKNMDLA